MALNIKATRKASLRGFAEGWDNCYVIIDVVTPEEANATSERIREMGEKDTAGVESAIRGFLESHIHRGTIINTDDEGVAAIYEFGKEEVSDVLRFIDLGWQMQLVGVATGSDRLKDTSN